MLTIKVSLFEQKVGSVHFIWAWSDNNKTDFQLVIGQLFLLQKSNFINTLTLYGNGFDKYLNFILHLYECLNSLILASMD